MTKEKRYKLYKETYREGKKVYLGSYNTKKQINNKIKKSQKEIDKYSSKVASKLESISKSKQQSREDIKKEISNIKQPEIDEGDNVVVFDTKNKKTYQIVGEYLKPEWKDLPEGTTIISKTSKSPNRTKLNIPDFWGVKK